jgi:hypothetical protein
MSEELSVIGGRGIARDEQGGLLALASMTEGDFEERLATLKRGRDRMARIKRELMRPDVHYGTIPGTERATLLKPGSEVLCDIYGFRPDFAPTYEYGDGETSPAIRIEVRSMLHRGDLSGPIVAVGYGSANSWERKHRYRSSERACPSCGAAGSIRRSGYQNKGGPHKGEKGWWCKDCRTNWDDPREPAIVEQQVGRVANPDQHDLENTLLKMAVKRAQIDATLRGTASSDLFTQDLEDAPHEVPGSPDDVAPADPAPEAPRPAPRRKRGRPAPRRKRGPEGEQLRGPEGGRDELMAEIMERVGADIDEAREFLRRATGRTTAKGVWTPEELAAGWAYLRTDAARQPGEDG